MTGTFHRYGARLASDRGSVGVLMALVMFVVMGMLFMTWNTVELSKEKMRLQNAADAAALEHATWQARGMNALQNLNDEAYLSLNTASKILIAAAVFEGSATALDAASIFFPPAKIAATAAHWLAFGIGCVASYIAHIIVEVCIVAIRFFYQYFTCAIGYIAAQQFAAQNGADSLIPKASAETAGFYWGAFAVGLSWPVADAFVLPVKLEDDPKAPFVSNKIVLKVFEISLWASKYETFKISKEWKFKPTIAKSTHEVEDASGDKSKKDKKYTLGVVPGPTLWIAVRYGSHIQTLPLDEWAGAGEGSSGFHSVPMFALAAARCVTGDLVQHSEAEGNNRPAGFGTGATAILVPVTEVAAELSTKLGTALGVAIFH